MSRDKAEEIEAILRREYPGLCETEISRLAETCATEQWFKELRRRPTVAYRGAAETESSKPASVGFAYPDDEDQEFREAVFRQSSQMTRDAVAFVISIVKEHRTGRAALLKLAAIDATLGAPTTANDIAKRFGVSPRMVQRLMKQTRKEFFGRKFVS